MSSNPRGSIQNPENLSPFRRLAALLEGVEPGESAIDLTIGEPRHPMPDFVADRLNEAVADFAKYPPILGTDALCKSIARWISRRYPGLTEAIDWQRHILPLCGSREGLFTAIFHARARKAQTHDPAVLIPNPFYFAYTAAAVAAQAEAIFLDAPKSIGYLPDLAHLESALLDRTIAMYLSSPSNPQGAVANEQYLKTVIGLAQRHDFLLFADECYSEIYYGSPPVGALEVACAEFGNFRNVLAFQSLSKRSNLPGLRSGFCAGDSDVITAFGAFRNVSCAQIPLPIQHVSAAVWDDEAHVERNRNQYIEKFDAADRLLGHRFGHRRPAGGFFLWLDMSAHGGGERAAKTLWKVCGVKVLPGAYLAQPTRTSANPGEKHVRLALVDDLAHTEDALQRVAKWAKEDG